MELVLYTLVVYTLVLYTTRTGMSCVEALRGAGRGGSVDCAGRGCGRRHGGLTWVWAWCVVGNELMTIS